MQLTGEYFDLGAKAATAGKSVTNCPYPTGAKRKEWLAGFFSVREFLFAQRQGAR
jgi:ribosome modulation factor